MTATYLALKLSSELNNSWPKHLVLKKTIQHWTSPISYLKTRFFNYSFNAKHDQELLEFILAKELPVNQLAWSPYSSLAWSFATHAHRKLSLARPSVIVPHSGLTRTALEMQSTAHVEGMKQLIGQIRESCVICRKQLEITCTEHPGKIQVPMVLPPSLHHSYIMVDILPDIKISAVTNQKQTRHTSKLNIGILIAVDMTTN